MQSCQQGIGDTDSRTYEDLDSIHAPSVSAVENIYEPISESGSRSVNELDLDTGAIYINVYVNVYVNAFAVQRSAAEGGDG